MPGLLRAWPGLPDRGRSAPPVRKYRALPARWVRGGLVQDGHCCNDQGSGSIPNHFRRRGKTAAVEESAGIFFIAAPDTEVADRNAGFNKPEDAEVLAPGHRVDLKERVTAARRSRTLLQGKRLAVMSGPTSADVGHARPVGHASRRRVFDRTPFLVIRGNFGNGVPDCGQAIGRMDPSDG